MAWGLVGSSVCPWRAGAALPSWARNCSEDGRVHASVAAPMHQTVASRLSKSHATRPASWRTTGSAVWNCTRAAHSSRRTNQQGSGPQRQALTRVGYEVRCAV